MEPKRRTLVCSSTTPRFHVPTILLPGIIFHTFQGELRVEAQQVLVRPDLGENERPRFDIDRGKSLQVNLQLFIH